MVRGAVEFVRFRSPVLYGTHFQSEPVNTSCHQLLTIYTCQCHCAVVMMALYFDGWKPWRMMAFVQWWSQVLTGSAGLEEEPDSDIHSSWSSVDFDQWCCMSSWRWPWNMFDYSNELGCKDGYCYGFFFELVFLCQLRHAAPVKRPVNDLTVVGYKADIRIWVTNKLVTY